MNYQSDGAVNANFGDNEFLSNQNFSKKQMNFSKKTKNKEISNPLNLNKVETFTQMIEKDIRTSIKKKINILNQYLKNKVYLIVYQFLV